MPLNIDEVNEDLSLEKVSSGDRPSLYALGMAAAQALKQTKKAVFMVDVLGRIRIMPNEAIGECRSPKIEEEELNSMEEHTAVEVLVAQGDTEETILQYLSRRAAKGS